MTLKEFLLSQGLLFLTFLLSEVLVPLSLGRFTYFMVNLLAFGSASLFLGWRLGQRPQANVHILSATLAFNAVTYALAAASGHALPPLLTLAGDFLLVAGISLVMVNIGTKYSRR